MHCGSVDAVSSSSDLCQNQPSRSKKRLHSPYVPSTICTFCEHKSIYDKESECSELGFTNHECVMHL